MTRYSRELVLLGQPCNDLVDKTIDMAYVSTGVLNDDIWRSLMRPGKIEGRYYASKYVEKSLTYVDGPDNKVPSFNNRCLGFFSLFHKQSTNNEIDNPYITNSW